MRVFTTKYLYQYFFYINLIIDLKIKYYLLNEIKAY